MGHVKEWPCERDAVTPMGTDESGKLLPLARPKWAGAMCKSQNALEVVLSVWNSGFDI
jgi:hypothetical protein